MVAPQDCQGVRSGGRNMAGQPEGRLGFDWFHEETDGDRRRAAGNAYYWKIVSKTMAGKTAAGPVWSFGT
jgi:hypothetical protein